MGADTFIRVGSAGGRQKDTPIGTPIIMTAAHRGEGTSKAYLPPEFPAVADLDVTNALVAAARELEGENFRVGIAFTRDAYYVQDHDLNALLTKTGVEAAEQEAAILFVVGSVRHVRVGGLVATDSNIWLPKQPTLAEKQALFMTGERRVITIALRAVQILASQA